MKAKRFFFTLFCLMLFLQLIAVEVVIPENAPSENALNALTIVAIHPFNWIEMNQGVFWSLAAQLRIEFLDRATGFMEYEYWYTPNVDRLMVNRAKGRGVLTGSFMILTPRPPPYSLRYKDPYGVLKPFLEACAGRDLNGKAIFHPDNLHVTVSVSCPEWRKHFTESAKKILDSGLDAINVDNIGIPPFAFGGDFSEWSVYAFRKHLSEKFSSEQLVKIGISDVESFDVRDYVKPKLNMNKLQGDILVISAPTVGFQPDEIESIKSFVRNGGGLLLQAEPQTYTVINELSQHFGILVKSGYLLSSNYLWDIGSFEVHNINRKHEIMKDVQYLTWNWGVALTINNPNATVLALTDEKTWIDKNNDLIRDQNEQKGPFPVIVALEYGRGRVIIHGDRSQDSIFDNHATFLRNALRWLSRGLPDGKCLVFDEIHREDATLSYERASSINAQHPEWYLYSKFKEMAISLGIRIASTAAPPSFPKDRLLREYVKFLHAELISFIREFVNDVKAYGRDKYERFVPVFGNQWLGVLLSDCFLRDIALDSIILSPYLDLIQIEVVPPTFPPVNRLTLLYKIGHAMAQNRKPVWQQGAFYENLGYKELDYRKVNITVLGIAEAYANGAIKELDLAGWPGFPAIGGTVVLLNMTVPRNVKTLVDFIWSNRKLLTGFKPLSKVAVVYSVPSFLWNLFPALGVFPELQRKELIGVADMLQWLHMPYDIIIFGHPDLMDDAYYLNRLKNYDLLILPALSDISPGQIQALANYVEVGGRILFTGNIPTYDHDHNQLTQEDKLCLTRMLQQYPNRVILVENLLGSTWYENMMKGYSNTSQYRDEFNRFKNIMLGLISKPLIKVSNMPGLVEVNVLKKNNKVSIHLINYRYELKTDSFEKIENIQLLIDFSVVGKLYDATYFSPAFETPLNYTYEDGYVKITVPSLDYWGFIVFNKPPTISIRISEATLPYGQSVSISGLVDPPTGNFTVELLYLSPKGLSVSKSLRVSKEGLYVDSFTPDATGLWRVQARLKENDDLVLDTSESLSFIVGKTPVNIALTVSEREVELGRRITVLGSISPILPNMLLTLTYIRPDGSTLSRSIVALSDGSFTDTYVPDKEGQWIVKASWAGDENHQGADSSTIFTVKQPLPVTYITITIILVVGIVGGLFFITMRKRRKS